MKKLQSLAFKIGVLSGIFFISLAQSAEAQSDNLSEGQKLWIADSLFNTQEYTDAFDVYSEIYLSGMSSPSMLLKMAFIKEGLEDYTMALYYLNDYYIITSDERALEKMETLAEEYNLQGYGYSDKEYFISQYHEYYEEIIFLLSGLSLIFFGGVIYGKFKKKIKPTGNFIGLVVSTVSLVLIFNFGMGYQEGIIHEPETYLMKGPSSGSGVLTILEPGHKVSIEGKKDVWYEVTWQDETAYIRENKILPVTTW